MIAIWSCCSSAEDDSEVWLEVRSLEVNKVERGTDGDMASTHRRDNIIKYGLVVHIIVRSCDEGKRA